MGIIEDRQNAVQELSNRRIITADKVRGLVEAGYSNRAISRKLKLSESTVRALVKKSRG